MSEASDRDMLKSETDIMRSIAELGPAEKKVIFEEEHEHNKVMEYRAGKLHLILKEFDDYDMQFGRATVNIDRGDKGTMHLHIRVGYRELRACPECASVREMSFALCDEGWIFDCVVCKGMVLRKHGHQGARLLRLIHDARGAALARKGVRGGLVLP